MSLKSTCKFVCISLIFLFISLLILVYVLNTPKYSGTQLYSKNYGEINISRDKYGIPYIDA